MALNLCFPYLVTSKEHIHWKCTKILKENYQYYQMFTNNHCLLLFPRKDEFWANKARSAVLRGGDKATPSLSSSMLMTYHPHQRDDHRDHRHRHDIPLRMQVFKRALGCSWCWVASGGLGIKPRILLKYEHCLLLKHCLLIKQRFYSSVIIVYWSNQGIYLSMEIVYKVNPKWRHPTS